MSKTIVLKLLMKVAIVIALAACLMVLRRPPTIHAAVCCEDCYREFDRCVSVCGNDMDCRTPCLDQLSRCEDRCIACPLENY
jgi:hypothetical protein